MVPNRATHHICLQLQIRDNLLLQINHYLFAVHWAHLLIQLNQESTYEENIYKSVTSRESDTTIETLEKFNRKDQI